MARPKPDLPESSALEALIDAENRLAVRVTPGSKTEGLIIVDGVLSAKVRAKPQDGKANEAVRSLLADCLDLAPSRLELLRGATSREKLFRISR